MAAARSFMKAYAGVYSESMMDELSRRFPRIAKRFEDLRRRGLVSTTNPAKFTADDIKEYVRERRSSGNRPDSIRHDVSSLNMLCMFVSNNNCVEQARVRYPLLFPRRSDKRLPVIERVDFDMIVAAAENLSKDAGIKRICAYAETVFALCTGPRTQELQHAKVRYLDTDLMTIHFDHVKGRGTYGQERTVPIRPEGRSILRRWLTLRDQNSEYLFPNPDGNFRSLNTLTQDRNIVIADLGLNFDYRKCRRTYAQYLIDDGFPVDKVASYLAIHHQARRSIPMQGRAMTVSYPKSFPTGVKKMTDRTGNMNMLAHHGSFWPADAPSFHFTFLTSEL